MLSISVPIMINELLLLVLNAAILFGYPQSSFVTYTVIVINIAYVPIQK